MLGDVNSLLFFYIFFSPLLCFVFSIIDKAFDRTDRLINTHKYWKIIRYGKSLTHLFGFREVTGEVGIVGQAFLPHLPDYRR